MRISAHKQPANQCSYNHPDTHTDTAASGRQAVDTFSIQTPSVKRQIFHGTSDLLRSGGGSFLQIMADSYIGFLIRGDEGVVTFIFVDRNVFARMSLFTLQYRAATSSVT